MPIEASCESTSPTVSQPVTLSRSPSQITTERDDGGGDGCGDSVGGEGGGEGGGADGGWWADV